MATYKTPDVYIEEISVFPPSVAEVETCIPAFIGYTQMATKITAGDLKDKPTRITSMLDYAKYFGGAPEVTVTQVDIDNSNNYVQATMSTKFYMYDSLRLFYANGGGDCYITSVGTYSEGSVALAKLQVGLAAVEMVDEPTILLFPDAVSAASSNDLYTLQQDALSQANKLKDRFCVFDLHKADPTGAAFRDKVGINYLKYGSAYTPWLKVSLSKNITYKNIRATGILKKAGSNVSLSALTSDPGLKALIDSYDALFNDITTVNADALSVPGAYRNLFQVAATAFNTTTPTDGQMGDVLEAIYAGFQQVDDWATTLTCTKLTDNATGAIKQKITTRMNGIWTSLVALEKELDTEITAAYTPVFSALAPALGATWTAHGTVTASSQISGTTDVARFNEGFTIAKALFEQAATAFAEVLDAINSLSTTLESALLESFPLYKTIIQGLNDSATEMPPSGAVVGVYAATDRDRGVWKAPANVSLASVIGPNTVFTASQLDALNIDVNAGKSINAIRSFVGKGTLIWGARTLAGNDNEWRYVPVRRFFNTVEESIKKSTYWAVFEPNNGNTWVKVKGMIENYLTNKWKEGALVGAKPDEAFFVRIGLGTTMSAQDILEGYMKVEIGMAVVRPAEFIVLKFSHMLQQS
ncbi:MAG: phage tail sheath family protein [Bacteroidia bacterium]